jgi:hypothetical protein
MMSEKVDVVWMLGNGSQFNDWELRMSMRSFEKHFRDCGQFWIIGSVPEWVNRETVRCLDWPDPYKSCKDANLVNKAVALGAVPELTEDFILSSDDQFVLRDCGFEEFRPYYVDDLAKRNWPEKPAGWQKRLHHTMAYLKTRDFPTFDFDGHVPYPMRKSRVAELLHHPYAHGDGLTIFTLYFNAVMAAEGAVSIREKPTRAGIYARDVAPHTVAEKLAANLFCSCGSLTPQNWFFPAAMEARFPHPTAHELDGAGGWSLGLRRVEKLRWFCTAFEEVVTALENAAAEGSPAAREEPAESAPFVDDEGGSDEGN